MVIVKTYDGLEIDAVYGSSVLTYVSPTLNSVEILGDGVQTDFGLIRQASEVDSIVDENQIPYTQYWKLSEDGYFIIFVKEIPNYKLITVWYRPQT